MSAATTGILMSVFFLTAVVSFVTGGDPHGTPASCAAQV
jgi:hypothetical protein